jgi:predicted nucleotidyltransferase
MWTLGNEWEVFDAEHQPYPEDERDVRILYAVESGSRAWGLDAADSDFDVRGFYMHPPEWYLHLDARRDEEIRFEQCDTGELVIDVQLWDIYKMLALLQKKNPPLIEWLHSAIVYQNLLPHPIFASLRAFATSEVGSPSIFYHYRQMALGNYKKYIVTPSQQDKEVGLKRYLYVLRPLLCLLHIEMLGSWPPQNFEALLSSVQNHVETPVTLRVAEQIREIVAKKREGGEWKADQPLPDLNAWIEAELEQYAQKAPGDPVNMQALERLRSELFAGYPS